MSLICSPLVQTPTIADLYTILSGRELAVANAKLPRKIDVDPTLWPGVDDLAQIAVDLTGRPLDPLFVADWARGRLKRAGVSDPDAAPITEAVEAFGRIGDVHCPRCGERHPDRGAGRRSCQRCRDGARDGFTLTMGPLIAKARHAYAHPQLIDEVGPEIRSLACDKFGHDGFTMRTWVRMVDWLETLNATEGPVATMLRSRVVELLRPAVVVSVPAEPAGVAHVQVIDEEVTSKPAKKKKWTNEEANSTLADFLATVTDPRHVTIRTLATATGIPLSSIHGTQAWADFVAKRSSSGCRPFWSEDRQEDERPSFDDASAEERVRQLAIDYLAEATEDERKTYAKASRAEQYAILKRTFAKG